MSALRALAAAAVAAAALLTASAADAGEPATAKVAPPPASAKAPDASRADARPASWSGPDRPRVTPGILVRAAKRAQQRDADACGPCAARNAAQAGEGGVESIEIDWHAASPTP